jgi:hypothetical protein
MRLIKGFIFIANIIGWLIADIYLWTVSWCCGIGGLVGMAAFFFGYSVSQGMTIAPRDFWRLPQYAIFKKKLVYGNSVGGSVTAIVAIVLFILKVAVEAI